MPVPCLGHSPAVVQTVTYALVYGMHVLRLSGAILPSPPGLSLAFTTTSFCHSPSGQLTKSRSPSLSQPADSLARPIGTHFKLYLCYPVAAGSVARLGLPVKLPVDSKPSCSDIDYPPNSRHQRSGRAQTVTLGLTEYHTGRTGKVTVMVCSEAHGERRAAPISRRAAAVRWNLPVYPGPGRGMVERRAHVRGDHALHTVRATSSSR
jgi:hypothetical protein